MRCVISKIALCAVVAVLFAFSACNLDSSNGKPDAAANDNNDSSSDDDDAATVDDDDTEDAGDDDENDDDDYEEYSIYCRQAIKWQAEHPPHNDYIYYHNGGVCPKIHDESVTSSFRQEYESKNGYSLSCFNVPKIIKEHNPRMYASFIVNVRLANREGKFEPYLIESPSYGVNIDLMPDTLEYISCDLKQILYEFPINYDCLTPDIFDECYWQDENYEECLSQFKDTLEIGEYSFSVGTGAYKLVGRFWVVEYDCPIEEDCGETCSLLDPSIRGRYDDYMECFDDTYGTSPCAEFDEEGNCIKPLFETKEELKEFWCPGGRYEAGLCIFDDK